MPKSSALATVDTTAPKESAYYGLTVIDLEVVAQVVVKKVLKVDFTTSPTKFKKLSKI